MPGPPASETPQHGISRPHAKPLTAATPLGTVPVKAARPRRAGDGVGMSVGRQLAYLQQTLRRCPQQRPAVRPGPQFQIELAKQPTSSSRADGRRLCRGLKCPNSGMPARLLTMMARALLVRNSRPMRIRERARLMASGDGVSLHSNHRRTTPPRCKVILPSRCQRHSSSHEPSPGPAVKMEQPADGRPYIRLTMV